MMMLQLLKWIQIKNKLHLYLENQFPNMGIDMLILSLVDIHFSHVLLYGAKLASSPTSNIKVQQGAQFLFNVMTKMTSFRELASRLLN